MDWKINKPKDMKLLNKNTVIMLSYKSLVKWMMQKGLMIMSLQEVFKYLGDTQEMSFFLMLYALSEKAFLLKK